MSRDWKYQCHLTLVLVLGEFKRVHGGRGDKTRKLVEPGNCIDDMASYFNLSKPDWIMILFGKKTYGCHRRKYYSHKAPNRKPKRHDLMTFTIQK